MKLVVCADDARESVGDVKVKSEKLWKLSERSQVAGAAVGRVYRRKCAVSQATKALISFMLCTHQKHFLSASIWTN